MLPDLSRTDFNILHEGKAFTVLVESNGGAITNRQDITEFLNEVRALIRENQLVLVKESRV
jgi:hypothetical protein